MNNQFITFRSFYTGGYMKAINFILLCLITNDTYAHGGRLDKVGGHYDIANSAYHCHSSTCRAAPSNVNMNRFTSKSIYNRDSWGAWSDIDMDCMNTRHEMLLSQAIGPVTTSTNGCYVLSGTWLDPYSGQIIYSPSDLDVDHVIPLKWASMHGGFTWLPRQKNVFANDPLNLLLVDDSLNQSKGFKGPGEWMPPNMHFNCQYLNIWKAVLNKYKSLKMTKLEEQMFNSQIKTCF